ncbi:protein ORF19 [Goose adenovirus 4]|nr:protein ORF19 [Goose adenovirus 4]
MKSLLVLTLLCLFTQVLASSNIFISGYGDGRFYKEELNNETFSKLQNVSLIKGNTLILLIHGYTKANETDTLLEYHSKMTPGFTVLMLDWRYKVSSSLWGYFFYFSTAKEVSSLDLNNFLFHFNNFSISCIGHSLGAHVCGSICRNLKNVSMECDRIVGLDAASPGFWKKSHELAANRLDRKDAKYVAALMSSTKIGGLSDPSFAHEYITSNIDGREIAECPSYGKYSTTLCGYNLDYNRVCVNFSIGNGFGFSCSHTMAVLIFAKSLDIFSSLSVVGLDKFNSSLVISSWNGYTMSQDLRFPVIPGGGWLSSNESAYFPLHLVLVFLNSTEAVQINTTFGRMERVSGLKRAWVVFGKDALERSYLRFYLNSSSVSIDYVRISKSRVIPVDGKLETAQIYSETRDCKRDGDFEVYCVFDAVSKLSLVPRNTSITKPIDSSHCRLGYPFSSLLTNESFTVLGQIMKDVRIRVGSRSIDFVRIEGGIAMNWGVRCEESEHWVKFEDGVLVLRFYMVGVYKVVVSTPFKNLYFEVFIGKTALVKPTSRITIERGASVTLQAFHKVCHTARWYRDGLGVGCGCKLNVSREGYYKFVIVIGSRFLLQGDFVVSELESSRAAISFEIIGASIFAFVSLGIFLGVGITMLIFCYFRKL